jgi:hypothetical protein
MVPDAAIRRETVTGRYLVGLPQRRAQLPPFDQHGKPRRYRDAAHGTDGSSPSRAYQGQDEVRSRPENHAPQASSCGSQSM